MVDCGGLKRRTKNKAVKKQKRKPAPATASSTYAPKASPTILKPVLRAFNDGQSVLCGQECVGTSGGEGCYYQVLVQKSRRVNGLWQYYVAHSRQYRHWDRYVTQEDLKADTANNREKYLFEEKQELYQDPSKSKFEVDQKILCYDDRDGVYHKAIILQVMRETDVASNVYWHHKVHFFGWKNTFDKWVLKENLLEDTPKNRAKYLYTEAISAVAAASKPSHDISKATVVEKNSFAIYSGPPDEPLEAGWPGGWTKKVYQRKSGDTKGSQDRYWFTPRENYKLRSMREVKKFLFALQKTNDDEREAKKIFKSVSID